MILYQKFGKGSFLTKAWARAAKRLSKAEKYLDNVMEVGLPRATQVLKDVVDGTTKYISDTFGYTSPEVTKTLRADDIKKTQMFLNKKAIQEDFKKAVESSNKIYEAKKQAFHDKTSKQWHGVLDLSDYIPKRVKYNPAAVLLQKTKFPIADISKMEAANADFQQYYRYLLSHGVSQKDLIENWEKYIENKDLVEAFSKSFTKGRRGVTDLPPHVTPYEAMRTPGEGARMLGEGIYYSNNEDIYYGAFGKGTQNGYVGTGAIGLNTAGLSPRGILKKIKRHIRYFDEVLTDSEKKLIGASPNSTIFTMDLSPKDKLRLGIYAVDGPYGGVSTSAQRVITPGSPLDIIEIQSTGSHGAIDEALKWGTTAKKVKEDLFHYSPPIEIGYVKNKARERYVEMLNKRPADEDFAENHNMRRLADMWSDYIQDLNHAIKRKSPVVDKAAKILETREGELRRINRKVAQFEDNVATAKTLGAVAGGGSVLLGGIVGINYANRKQRQDYYNSLSEEEKAIYRAEALQAMDRRERIQLQRSEDLDAISGANK